MTHMNHTAKAAVQLAALACSMALFLAMTACGATPSVSSETSAAPSAAPSAVAATAEPTAENTVSPSPAEVSASQEVQSASALTMEEAKAVALEDAGLAEADVTVQKTAQESENGISVYDIEFLAGDVEYDYEINADTGEIYSKKVELRREAIAEADPSAGQITEENAKAIALEHAGLAEADVTFTKTKLDMDDGLQVYEIEFSRDSTAYEYEIHSQTGEIIKSDMERR